MYVGLCMYFTHNDDVNTEMPLTRSCDPFQQQQQTRRQFGIYKQSLYVHIVPTFGDQYPPCSVSRYGKA